METVKSQLRISVPALRRRKSSRLNSEPRIVALTAYDFTFASILDEAGVDLILVGDSLASVVQGLPNTLPVTLDEMIYHCRAVSRGVSRALLVGDMPFLSYQVSSEQALLSAGRLIKEGGVAAVKLEGGVFMEETIARLVQVDIPVVGHIGLTPQSYHRMGGHRVQGRASASDKNQFEEIPEAGSRERIVEDALAVQRAGAFAIVLEGMPSDLAQEITQLLDIPTIGIGAGTACDGQILVTHDLLGLSAGETPSFVKKYADLRSEALQAITVFKSEIHTGTFPDKSHSFSGDQKKLRHLRSA